ncbi:hypothetical protein BDW59DRAFT_172918 [Aspergillus cavernicola]|uniref:S-adenosyl-L-methionine-dependent methyltransferase n=1 Tax=Aspergillus cavernicola TaxID=176166 RepID=A0ABR4I9G9_9EURO
MSKAPEIYALGRDGAESKRTNSHTLNSQHKLILDIVDGPIDRSVPLDKIFNVAEVATGTGLVSNNPDRYFHGFGISAAQFPPAPEGIELSVHDVLKPFPAKHHNRYDFVHSNFQAAVTNMLTILKPGGRLQWVEIDFTELFNAESTLHPKAVETVQLWGDYIQQNNISQSAPKALYSAFEKVDLVNVVNRSFPVRGREDLKIRAQNWQLQFFSSVMPLLVLKSGQAANSDLAKEKAAQIIGDLETAFAEGEVVDVRFSTLVGQKVQ